MIISKVDVAQGPHSPRLSRKRRRLSIPQKIASTRTAALMLILLFGPTEARLLNNIFSCTTMVGLAAQSSRWKVKMEGELSLAAEKSAQATGWQEAAAEDQAAADEWTEKTMAEKEKATTLQEEANGLYAKAEAEEGKAATTEEEAAGLAVQASETEAQSTGLFAEAAVEEAVAEEDAAQATADAAIGAQDAAEAEADEATTAVCQFVPLVDVVCDVVGGVAAIALESQSVRLAVGAAENFAAAAAAQAQADSAAAEATELQAAASEEGEQAAALQSEAAALEAQASEELELAEADQTAAKETLAQSALDEAAAGEEETKALTEEDASAKAWQESVHHGANACGNALMMSVVSAVALLFWLLRIAGSTLVPVLRPTFGFLWTLICCSGNASKSTPLITTSKRDLLIGVSHLFHHWLFFVLSFGLWGFAFVRFRQMTSIKAMGGTVLGFSASVAASQSLLLHTVSRVVQHNGSILSSVWVGSCEFGRRMLILCPLVAMEILLIWVNAGHWVFVSSVVEQAQSFWVWGLLAVTLTTNYVCFVRCKNSVGGEMNVGEREAEKCAGDALVSEGQGQQCSADDEATFESVITRNAVGYGSIDITIEEGIYGEGDDDWEALDPASENVELLRNETLYMEGDKEEASLVQPESDSSFLNVLVDDFRRFRLLLVFELLMASIILAILLQSAPVLCKLFPATKVILLAAHPNWHVMIALSGAAALILLLCACL